MAEIREENTEINIIIIPRENAVMQCIRKNMVIV